MSHTHGPIQEEQHKRMNDLAAFLDSQFNGDLTGTDREWGFAMLIFPFKGDDKSRMNYISNAQRADMLVAMKEFIARNEGRHHEHKEKQ